MKLVHGSQPVIAHNDAMTAAGVALTVIAGGATIVGAAAIFLWRRRPGRRGLDATLGAAAGIMLAAAAFSLLKPALDGADRPEAVWLTAAFVIGAGATWAFAQVTPDEPTIPGERLDRTVGGRPMRLVAAVALHNVPEGMAVGVGVGHDPEGSGLALAGGIMTQNLPEGLAVAVALAALGVGRKRAFWLSSFTGLIEVAAGLFGLFLAGLSAIMLPSLLAAAAGAMLFVVSHEIIPETHRHGNENTATLGLILGFAGMVLLDALVA